MYFQLSIILICFPFIINTSASLFWRIMKKSLGQFFTKSNKVQSIFGKLVMNKKGTILEPSVGEGHLLSEVKLDNRKLSVVEYDKKLKSSMIKKIANYESLDINYGCFFASPIPSNITTIISNPPYVSKNDYLKHMSEEMKEFVKSHDYIGKYNITYLFIHKCAEVLNADGEMIFIVPKDFSYATSALELRLFLSENGHFTHWIDCGEEQVFDDASLETLVIFRWKKNTEEMVETKCYPSLDSFNSNDFSLKKEMFLGTNKMVLFTDIEVKKIYDSFVSLSSLFDVFVGSVSGADPIFKVDSSFISEENNVALDWFNSGANKKDLFINTTKFNDFNSLPQQIQDYLLSHKETLLKRYGIDEDSWWQWSFLRNAHVSLHSLPDRPRIFTFSKTRAEKPFVIGDQDGFVGSVYGIFPKESGIDLNSVINILNSDFYKKLYSSSGLAVGNKFQATPSALKDLPIPPKSKIKKVALILSDKSKDEQSMINDLFSLLKIN